MNDHSGAEQDRRVTAKREFIACWERSRDAEGAQPGLQEVYPYPGLRSFRPTEADLFYGRDSQINDLRDLLADHNIIVVLGGSGSGKSSLVRAGLVPKLNSTTPIPERVGAWYVVEFRPKLDPVNELFDALLNQLIKPTLALPQPGDADEAPDQMHRFDPVKERGRRIGALNAAFNLECPFDAPDAEVLRLCRERLREILFEGDVVDTASLFDFVEERLRILDEALSGGATSGAPNLLLLIDQFEEVFKPRVDPAGRDMVMSLINSIHAYRPFNLFLIITMRSEELHRCSEFLGVTEVVNSSLYLVDLIGGRNIEQAIVGPARRVLKSWDLDSGDPETGPYTRRALSRLHQVFDEGRDVLPHPADQLPLMQHLLPLVWDKAIERWQAAKDEHAPLKIDLEDLQAVPGWTAPDRPLIGTLNARADSVLRRAIEAGAKKAKGVGKDAVEQLIRVGFCCLAQLDDRGNVVRDFATLDQMLDASGICERRPQDREQCRQALQTAFGIFQGATLVNVGRSYDVNHEAFIRGWKKYENWLKDARRRADRLAKVDDDISRRRHSDEKAGFLVQLLQKGTDYILVRNLQLADQIAGDETSKELQDVLGPNSAFSEQWARQALERADAKSANVSAGELPVGARIGAIKKTIDDAVLYRSGARNRPRRFLLFTVLGVAFVLMIMAIRDYRQQVALAKAANDQLKLQANALESERKASVAAVIAEQSEKLNKQFRLFRLQAEATAGRADASRNLVDDREVYAALQIGLDTAAELSVQRAFDDLSRWYDSKSGSSPATSSIPESTAVFRTALRQLDRNVRNVLSDVSIKIVDNASDNRELESLNFAPANCTVTDPEVPVKSLIADETGSLGLQLRAEAIDGVRIITMNPIRRDASGEIQELRSSNFKGQGLTPGALVCLSHDANWFLMWRPQPERQAGEPPYIQRILWIKTQPEPAADDQWHAELNAPRSPQNRQTWKNVEKLSQEYARLNSMARAGGRVFESFRSGNRVGFLISLEGNRAAVLWTSTGLLDPEAVNSGLPHELVDCPFNEKGARDQGGRTSTVLHCEMGPIAFDGLDHFLTADFIGCPFSPLPLCVTELGLDYKPRDAERGSTRATFQHNSSKIVAAAIWDDSLWVRDANGQVWRYVVGLRALQDLLTERWKGVSDPTELANATYSDSCKQANCDRISVPGWPGR